MSPTKLEFFAIYHACYKHQLINVKSGIKNIRWHNCEHYFYKKKTCSWSEKFRLRGKFPLQFYLTVEGYLLKQFFQCWIKTVIFEWQYWTLNVVLNMIGLRLEHSPINRIIRNTSFFYLGWCPWTPKERFFEKNFCCKSSLWPHYLFQYCLSQNATERQHAKILSFSTSVRLVWRAEGTWQFRKKDAAVLNFEICHLLFDLTW